MRNKVPSHLESSGRLIKWDENSWTTAALKNDKDTLYMYYLVDDNYYNLIYEEYLLEWTFLPVLKLLRDTGN